MTVPRRTFVIPDDPADRLWRRRSASRVIITDPRDRILLFCDTDPGYPDVHWWVTPGGGIDPGESERQAAVREVAEETGLVVTEADLVGPVARRLVRHGYSDEVLEQHEAFFLVRVEAFEVDVSAFTEEERITMVDNRWWSPKDIARTDEWIWPRELLDLVEHAGTGSAPIELGLVTEESTRPV